ncbi:MAG: zinc ribbon-containing protein [Gammaproteobacteria bacterium]|nr:zinc ribbon-containing protein [Gammaproteobacteria bacterium]
MSASDKQNESSLVEAYNQMMLRVRDSIDNAEANAMPTLQKAIEQAKDQAIHLGEVSLEEAEEIGNYIKRDINDAAEYLMETSHEFSEWLMLDIDIIEQKVLELFLSVADKTRIELEQLSQAACNISSESANSQYRSGEITGPGSLICTSCEQMIQFNTTDRIPDCEQCGGDVFKRAEI